MELPGGGSSPGPERRWGHRQRGIQVRGGTRGGAAAYVISKAAVLRLTEVLAAELAPSKVRVNAILPGVIDIAANREALPPSRLAAAVPAEDIAAVIAFLISDAAWPISGALIPTYGWS